MTTRSLIPVVTFALVTAAGCKKDEGSTTPDDATADADSDDADIEADDAPEEADAADDDAPVLLSKASFDETIHDHFEDVTNCYLTALEQNPDLAGTFSAEFTFDADGTPTSVTAIDGSTLSDEALTACVAAAATTWAFDRPHEPGMTMRYDYNLAPG